MAETDYNKYVFGAYLNMALDNFLNTVKLLAAKMKVDYEEGSPASIIKKYSTTKIRLPMWRISWNSISRG